jgi:signal transduction histidine kinase
MPWQEAVHLLIKRSEFLPNLFPGIMNTLLKRLITLKISISDTGVGISPDILVNLFDPFFTTKEQGKGVGLGLSGVYGCVQSHGGRITVQSQLGEGSTFTIYLPMKANSPIDLLCS